MGHVQFPMIVSFSAIALRAIGATWIGLIVRGRAEAITVDTGHGRGRRGVRRWLTSTRAGVGHASA